MKKHISKVYHNSDMWNKGVNHGIMIAYEYVIAVLQERLKEVKK